MKASDPTLDVFIQRSRIGGAIFVLRPETLEISEGRGHNEMNTTFNLKNLASDYDIRARHFPILVAIPLGISAVLTFVARLLYLAPELPSIFYIYALMFAAIFLVAAIRGTPAVEFFVFNNRMGKPQFRIVREKNQSEDCNNFIRLLVERIEKSERGESLIWSESDATRPVLESSVRYGESSVNDLSKGNWWKGAMVFGCGSVCTPVVFYSNPDYHGFAFMLTLLLMTVGLMAGIMSLTNKEGRVFLVIVGMILSLVPAMLFSGMH